MTEQRDPAARLEPQETPAAIVEQTMARQRGDTVAVCCKVPNGMELRLFKEVQVNQPVMGGGFQAVREFHEDTNVPRVRIKGPAHYLHMAPAAMIVGGYAITPGVSKAFWKKWLEQNKSLAAVKNRMIWAQETPDAAVGMAEDLRDTVSNLHPLVPDKDKRAPKPLNKQLSEVQTGTTT